MTARQLTLGALLWIAIGPTLPAQGPSTALSPAADRGRAPLACATLTGLRLPDVTITAATAIPEAAGGQVRAAHCRVTGIIGTEIRFELLLPERWNGKFFMGGGGGFVGSIQNSAQTTVNEGYATVGTDTGHQGEGTDASWAHNNLERRVNFGYLAVHRTAEVAKAIIASHYATPSSRNYFMGCSRGGGQAFMEAQRFPTDFDGIVAGAPAFDWTGIAAQFIRNAQAAFPDPKQLTPLLTRETMQSVEAAILDRCDTTDGLRDGIIQDPTRCAFDVDSLAALSAAQRAALKTIYAPTTARDGELHPGQPFGGEGQTGGWTAWITGGALPAGAPPSLRFAFGTGIAKYLVFNDPDWDYSTYDLNHWTRDSALAATYLNATSPNLDAFKARGGKLILWHGWADPALTAFASLRYHDQVHARDAQAADYFRTFMLPGVLHCGGGTGPSQVDWPSTIAKWVEGDQAPDRLVASRIENGAVARTRPLCPHPQQARYNGSGNPDDEKNFVCRTP